MFIVFYLTVRLNKHMWTFVYSFAETLKMVGQIFETFPPNFTSYLIILKTEIRKVGFKLPGATCSSVLEPCSA